jgi:hypothetical protein
MKRFLKRSLLGAALVGAFAIASPNTVRAQRPPAEPPVGGGQPPAGNPAGGLPGAGQQKPMPPAGGQLPPNRPMPPSRAQPAQPKPGEGKPAEPALPGNPRARDNAERTPSREGLPANVKVDQVVNGLTQVNIGTLNINNIQNNIVVVGSINNSQVASLMTTLQANAQAQSIAQQLTTRLIEQRILTQGQQVVGALNGQIFVTSGRGNVRRRPGQPQRQHAAERPD